MTGYIYLIHCSESDKGYVGLTTKTVEDRFHEHKLCGYYLIRARNDPENVNSEVLKRIQNIILYKAMALYGPEKFTVKTLAEVEIADNKLSNAEIQAIIDHKTLIPNGYNMRSGGTEGYSHSDETIRLMKLKKCENIDQVRNEKLIGLPPHTAYRNNPIKGEEILINLHPLCKHNTFSVKPYGSFESAKEAVSKFIKELEESNQKYESKIESDLPTGISRTKKGYRLNVVRNRKVICDKRFERKDKTLEENKKAAMESYTQLIQSLQK